MADELDRLLERTTARAGEFLRGLFGFVTGATPANFTALAAARHTSSRGPAGTPIGTASRTRRGCTW
jgi:hypothetical protein